jgi:preprotein translocase subunit SecD
VARSPGLVGESLLGLSAGTQRPPNRTSLGVGLLLIFVMTLAALYAAPNLFQPDPALQIRGVSEQNPVDQATIDRALDALRAAEIPVKGSEFDGQNGLIRVSSDEDQLRGRDVVAQALNAGVDRRYVVALNRASTTPRWLQDIGGRPMSLGLDLSGGVHFLLEVDMDKFVGDRMEKNEEAIRDLLVRERIRYSGRD